jgi:AraC-like DNA-binding protein
MTLTKRKPDGVARQRACAGPEQATVRIGVNVAVPAVLVSLGANPAEVLAEAGFDPKLFDDPDNLISFAARGRLFSHCLARTGCRHFGLLVGQQGGLHSLGLVGLLAKYSPDVGTALRQIVRYLHLHVRGAAPTLAVDGPTAVLSFDIYLPHTEANDQVGDGAAAVMFNILRSLCGTHWTPIEVGFAHREPDNLQPFRRFFRAPLRFDAEQYSVVFSADCLGRGMPGFDAELLRLLQKQIDALAARDVLSLPDQVRAMLRTSLLTGSAKADELAARLSMSSRALRRRLNAHDTSYQELVNEIGFEIARQMLEDSAVEISQIAAMLDYANVSAFTRAFRGWSGTTPARWRGRKAQVARHAAGSVGAGPG